MNRLFRVFPFGLIASLFVVAGQAQTSIRAIVAADRTSVRAQPSFDAEILASLAKGQVVEVVGELMPARSQEAWSRVRMPPAVTVWVYEALVDPQKNEVKSKELNYRAGPGRNYSVLGELKKGDPIKVIRSFDGWLQIQPPTNAVAFIASRLLEADLTDTLELEVPTNAAAKTQPPIVSPSPLVDQTPAPLPPPRVEPEPTNSPAGTTTTPLEPTGEESIRVDTEPPAQPMPAQPTPTQEPTRVSPNPDSTTATLRAPLPLGSPRDQASQPRQRQQLSTTRSPEPPRFVVREGVVERTVSIQAPTNYELRDGFYREGVIDYLLLEPQKDLHKFSGKRVMVSGFEYRDSRWPTPVLKIQDVQLMP